MKHYEAASMLGQQHPSRTRDVIDSINRIQIAETLEEINQKTLTIRDQFAIAAMQSILSRGGVFTGTEVQAYKIADAMLKERKL